MLNIRPVWKADELKRFGELEEKYHYMGETHSDGDTLRLVIEDGGVWVAIVETSYHASTIEIDERHGVDFFAGAVRSEWAIETGYHGKRDFAYCEDVRTRRCNANIIGAMMLARTPAFVFMAKRGVANSQAFKEELQSDHALPLRMVVDAPSN